MPATRSIMCEVLESNPGTEGDVIWPSEVIQWFSGEIIFSSSSGITLATTALNAAALIATDGGLTVGWDGSAASPAISRSDDGDTGIFWGAADDTIGITCGGTARGTFNTSTLTLANNYSITFAGTGAATTRNNLGAAASGANSDITSLSGLSTPLSGGQGGTGVANTGKTITVSGNTTIGSSTHTVALATSGNTSITLPTSGTLATVPPNTVLSSDYSHPANNTTFANTNLTGTVGAGTWLIEVQSIFRNTGATPGWKIQIDSSGATFQSGYRWRRNTDNTDTIVINDQASGVAVQSGDDDGGGGLGGYYYVYTVASSGTFTVQCAQNVSDSAITKMLLGSFLRFTKLA